MLRVLALAVIILSNSIALAYAENISYYADMLKTGAYQIDYSIKSAISKDNVDNGYIGTGTIANDNARKMVYFSEYSYHTGLKKPYIYLLWQNVEGKEYGRYKVSDKEFNKNNIQIDSLPKYVSSYEPYFAALREMSWGKIDDITSMLGPIALQAGLLKVYDVVLVKEGNETHGNRQYNFLEYQITKPYKAFLRLYFYDGNLVRCIKSINNNSIDHEIFDNISLIRGGYCVLDILSFKNVVEDKYYTVPNN